MRSSLSTDEFKNQLTELTSVGEPTINGTPLAVVNIFSSSKYLFYGEFDNNCFRLTTNGITNITPYLLDGKYKPADDGTEVAYEVRKIWFGYIWVRLFPIIAIIIINYFLIHETGFFGMIVIILFNLLAILFFLPIVITIYQKKRLERLFKEHFRVK